MNFKDYLNRPFPIQESRWKVTIFISLFVIVFLFVFQPFGLNLLQENKLAIISGYGLVTLIVLVFNLFAIENIFHNFFNEKNWTIWKEFLWLICIIFSIGLGNVLYTITVLEYFKFKLSLILTFEFITLAVGIIPITVLIIVKHNILLKRNLRSAGELNENLSKSQIDNKKHIIRFYAENEKDSVGFDVQNFYYLESSGNYVDLYLLEDNSLTRKTFRNTLKRSLDYFKDIPEIVQCHRAFVVNTNKIIHANGNSQGLKLNLEDCNTEIPVSRAFVHQIKNKIKKNYKG